MAVFTETRGCWVLVDYLVPDHPALLSIGQTNFSGVSVRKNLDPLGREILMERLKTVAESGEGLDEMVTWRGRGFRVVVEPLFAPTSGSLAAILAVFVDEGDTLPPRPLAGALEWRISLSDRRIDTAWSDGMFDIYEVDRNGFDSPTGDMSQWVNEMISPEDRARMKVTIDSAIASSNGERYLVPYRVITRRNSANPGVRDLEVSGRVLMDDDPSVRWLVAVTREIHALTPVITPGFGDVYSGNLLRAAFDLCQAGVMMAIDTSVWQTFMTSDSWDDLNLQRPHHGYLPHIVHPGDYSNFRQAVETGKDAANTSIRMRLTDGTYQTCLLRSRHAGGVGEGDRYALCYLAPLPQHT